MLSRAEIFWGSVSVNERGKIVKIQINYLEG